MEPDAPCQARQIADSLMSKHGFVLVLTSLNSGTRKINCLAASLAQARLCGLLQVMLELTQQSLAFQQERSQLTEMLQAQHIHMQQLVEENQTQEAALNGLSRHAQQADQQVQTDITATGLARMSAILQHQDPGRNVYS